MIAYVLRRLLQLPLVVLALAIFGFVILRGVPGGPFDLARARPPALELRDAGCDPRAPIAALFVDALRGWSSLDAGGCAGRSLAEPDRSVREIVREGLPVSLALLAMAIAFALCVGVPTGMLIAVLGTLHPRPALTRAFGAVSSTLVAVPPYVLGPALILAFSLGLRLFPPARWDGPSTWILPVLTLGAAPLGNLARVAENAVRGGLARDLVRAGRRGSGVRLAAVVRRALRTGLLPIVSALGPIAGGLFTSSVVVEMVFHVPGLGRAFLNAAIASDENVVLGATLIYAALLLGVSLALDIAYGLLDPRVRVSS
jgi:oligopeptide transport system permease protein